MLSICLKNCLIKPQKWQISRFLCTTGAHDGNKEATETHRHVTWVFAFWQTSTTNSYSTQEHRGNLRWCWACECVCVFACCVFVCVCSRVGVKAVCVSAGECRADRAWALWQGRATRYAHRLPKCLQLKTSVTGSIDESPHRVFSSCCRFSSTWIMFLLESSLLRWWLRWERR